jgi:cysteine-S-conjugate beta-lyase
VIIPDERLRAPFAQRLLALGISPNSFGLHMATAAYTPEGAAWLEELMHYLEGNRRIFDAGVAEIPGVRSMPLEATYLSWVDFGGTGMTQGEITDRVERGARIAANHGPTFGAGGDGFLRFNIATQRVRVTEAVDRLKKAFADLQ